MKRKKIVQNACKLKNSLWNLHKYVCLKYQPKSCKKFKIKYLKLKINWRVVCLVKRKIIMFIA